MFKQLSAVEWEDFLDDLDYEDTGFEVEAGDKTERSKRRVFSLGADDPRVKSKPEVIGFVQWVYFDSVKVGVSYFAKRAWIFDDAYFGLGLS